MARIPCKTPLWPLLLHSHCSVHTAATALEGGLVTPMLQMKKLRPTSGQCIPGATQPPVSGALLWLRPRHLSWPLVLLVWPGDPFSILIPKQSFKTASHLSFPDSQASSGSLPSLGKNLTHHHGRRGPTELCGLISLHFHLFPVCTCITVSCPQGHTEKQQSSPLIKLFSVTVSFSASELPVFWAREFIAMGSVHCRMLSAT